MIVFGSAARGTGGPGSDVDLLVVIPARSSRRQLATEIDKALIGVPMPVDVIVVTPEELDRDRDQVGSIIRPALREGRVLYERAA